MSTDFSAKPRTPLLGIARGFLVFTAGLACAANGSGQTLIPGLSAGGTMRLFQTDLAVLESQQPRHDLPCVVTAAKPELDFDFMFHTGYEVQVPFRELAGDGNELTILFRVVPQDRPEDASYMVQSVPVPALDEVGKGASRLNGSFTLGEGKYHIDWLMRDRAERFCAVSWDLDTKLNPKDSQLKQWIPQALVQPRAQLFEAEEPVIRASEDGLPRFSIIVNLDPADPSAASIDDRVLFSLVAILRRMESDSRIQPYSIIVCSMGTQQVVYRRENKSIDLPALGEALKSLKLGMVDVKQLVSTNSPGQFATDLIGEQLRKESPEALVVLGAKAGWQTGVSREALGSLDDLDKPTFYLSYNAERQWNNLWPDPISSIVKRLRGFEYSITRPKDLFNAWSDVVSRIVRIRQAPQDSSPTKAAFR